MGGVPDAAQKNGALALSSRKRGAARARRGAARQARRITVIYLVIYTGIFIGLRPARGFQQQRSTRKETNEKTRKRVTRAHRQIDVGYEYHTAVFGMHKVGGAVPVFGISRFRPKGPNAAGEPDITRRALGSMTYNTRSLLLLPGTVFSQLPGTCTSTRYLVLFFFARVCFR